MGFRRGDIVIASSPGDYGKPSPCLVIQSDAFSDVPSVTVCPFTSDLRDDVPLLRQTVQPTKGNGLQQPSQIAIDKVTTLSLTRIGKRVGKLAEVEMMQVTRALAVFLGIA
ncbi:type II toxin-antitoxin system PemK/MazF family toxin [Aestuariivirga sp.]|uniref:type II toxin-antitoxin system PemK/MazF family toxin n=1 Tax=Aestuariivirga sp. TaxID=2650926 RepID=UPI0039E23A01